MPSPDFMLTLLKMALPVLLAGTLLGALRRAALWARGRPQAVAWWAGLLAMPRRYLVDLHAVVAREPLSARMHVTVATGLIASALLFVIDLYAGGAAWLQWAGRAASGVMLLGVFMVAWRRAGARLPTATHRSRGEWIRLAASLACAAVGLTIWFWAARSPGPSTSAHALAVGLILLSCADLLLGLTWGSALRHAFAGALNLAWHPRASRFGREVPDVGLAPLDLSAQRLGVQHAQDLAWNRILNIDACVQCGRCEAACPAFSAGLPLNPKAFVHDIAQAAGLGGMMGRYQGRAHPPSRSARESAAAEPMIVASDTVWSCTTCRACVHECPMMIEHVDLMVDLRRHHALDSGQIPGQAPEVLENLRQTDTQGGDGTHARLGWAADLSLPVLSPEGETDVLLWIGEGGFNERHRQTLRALVALMRRAGVDFAVLGSDELDCGDTARRLGEEAIFQDLAARNTATLRRRRFARIVTADPHVYNSLRNDYPLLGARFPVLHHSELLAELVQQGRLPALRQIEQPLAYHDPCYLARYNGEVNAPRVVLDHVGGQRVEMPRSGARTRCCGGGGGAPLTDIPGERRMADQRMDDVRATPAGMLAVACPNCMTMLEGVSGPRPQVVDIAELLARCTLPQEQAS